MTPAIVIASPHFLTLAFAAKHAPVIATLPTRIARCLGPLLGLIESPLPFDLEPLPVNSL